MKHLTIGMDIDGVIVDYGNAMLPLLSEVCHRPVLYHDLRYWDLSKALDLEEEVIVDVWEHVLGSDILRHASPIRGAIDGLSVLSKHEIWLVTGRPASMQSLTVSWLGEKNIKYDRLVFDSGVDKLSVGQNFDVFVEDNLEQACAIVEAGIFTLLLDQPWNQASILPKRCQRVPDWNAIVLSISKLEEAY